MTSIPLTLVSLTAPAPGRPLLVLGPSLGTATEPLWGRCAELLADDFEIVGWELPGHGGGVATDVSFRMEDIAEAVVSAVDEQLAGRSGETFYYAGDSIGGAVGLALLLYSGGRVEAATLACTGARIGTPEGWADRASTVRAQGMSVMVESSARRWFGPGFLEREPDASRRLLEVLQHADTESYGLACEALAAFDVRAELDRIRGPLTLVAGAEDQATPAPGLEEIAQAVPGARLMVLDGVAHLAPIEAPAPVADAVRAMLSSPAVGRDGSRTVSELFDAGDGCPASGRR